MTSPVAVRYGWGDNPECNLINATGLPASPFRTDEWPFTPVNPPPAKVEIPAPVAAK